MRKTLLAAAMILIVVAPLCAQQAHGNFNVTFGGWNNVGPSTNPDYPTSLLYVELTGVAYGSDKQFGAIRSELHQFVNLADGSIHGGTAIFYFYNNRNTDDPHATPARSMMKITYSGGGTNPLTSPGNVAAISGTWQVVCAGGVVGGMTGQGTWSGVATMGMLDASGLWPLEPIPGTANVTFTGQLVPGGSACVE